MNYANLRAYTTLAIVLVVAYTLTFARNDEQAILNMAVACGLLNLAGVVFGILADRQPKPMAVPRNPEPIRVLGSAWNPDSVGNPDCARHCAGGCGGIPGIVGGCGVLVDRDSGEVLHLGVGVGLGADVVGDRGRNFGAVVGADVRNVLGAGVVGARFWDGASAKNLPKLDVN